MNKLTGTVAHNKTVKVQLVGGLYTGVALQMNPQYYLRMSVIGQRYIGYGSGAYTNRRVCTGLKEAGLRCF